LKIELEPNYLTVEEIEDLDNAIGLIQDETIKETASFGDEDKEVYRCTLRIQGKEGKGIWTPNQRSLRNLVGVWGNESLDWVGKKINLKIEKSSKGRKMIVAYPVIAEGENELPSTEELP